MLSLARLFSFFFNAPATTEIYTLSLHDALPIYERQRARPHPGDRAGPAGGRQELGAVQVPLRQLVRLVVAGRRRQDRKSTRLNSSHMSISYAVFCLKKKNKNNIN